MADYLGGKLDGAQIEVRDEFFDYHLAEREGMIDSVAERIARCKVRDIENPKAAFEPIPGEIDYERRWLQKPASKPIGILYDGVKFLQILWELIPEAERCLEHVHIVFTNQLLGTFDRSDKRYHARVSMYGFPSIISTTGVVEGPAKPKEFYLLKQQYTAMGTEQTALLKLKEEFKGKFIDYDDERLTEVLKGYVMQALVYHLTGHPFCDDKNCRLYNAHWQEEMIHAQWESPYEFCKRHENLLRRLK